MTDDVKCPVCQQVVETVFEDHDTRMLVVHAESPQNLQCAGSWQLVMAP